MEKIRTRAMQAADIEAVSAFADRVVGAGYYPPETVAEYLQKAQVGPLCTAYVAAREDGAIVGFRLVLPPGRWDQGRGQGLCVERWPHPLAATAYFQSCFIDPDCRGAGIGGRLAYLAIDDLRRMGAKAIAVHSWKESPHDSSRRYLSRLGFVAIAEHPQYWADVDYLCAGCQVMPCTCTAIEMILDLEAK